ncbi:MAG: 6-pyruvoyl trahydropterin synthase family protein [Pseudobdellovibrionaceae bacterium]|jgi:6-pyruvoyltetrahydropterin/6-carboxytetrahydropterin synthase
MKPSSTTTLHLYKQNFKFSSAHFLIFDEKSAEKLHGHNYQVRVDIQVPSEVDMSEKGFFFDFNEFKQEIKRQVDHWDEHVLLPAEHPDMKIKANGPSLEVRFRDRFYVFPKNEVHLLPVTNTSVEQLARLLGEKLHLSFKKWGVRKLKVAVEETRGQSASVIFS